MVSNAEYNNALDEFEKKAARPYGNEWVFHNQIEDVTCHRRVVRTYRVVRDKTKIPNWLYCSECDLMIRVDP